MRGAEAPGVHLPGDGERGGGGALLGPPTHGANIPLAQREGGGPAPSQAPRSPSHCGALRTRREQRSSERQVGKHHLRGPGEPETGLGERDVGRGLLFQVPETEMTAPAPCGGGQRTGSRGQGVGPSRGGLSSPSHPGAGPPLTFRGLRHGGAQAVHVVAAVAVVTEQQLVLGGETCPAGTLGARAPETGWGAGAGAGHRGGEVGPSTERAPRGLCATESSQSLAGPSTTPLSIVSLQSVVWASLDLVEHLKCCKTACYQLWKQWTWVEAPAVPSP